MNPRMKTPGRSRTVISLTILTLVMLLAAPLAYVWPAAAAPSAAVDQVDQITWITEAIDSAETFENMSSRHTRLDSNGNPGMVFGSRNLYYAKRGGSDWTVSVIDASYGVGAYASLAFETNNRPHISYYDSTNNVLKYAVYFNDQWRVEVVQIGGSSINCQYSSIDLDSSARPHIACYDAVYEELVHIYRNADGLWVKEVVNSVGNVGKYASLDMDGNTPHIAYYSEFEDALMYAVPINGIWNNRSIEVRSQNDPPQLRGVGLYPSIIFSRGKAHISYHNAIKGDLMYAWVQVNSNGAFSSTTEIIDDITGQSTGLYTSIDVDNNGNPYISYFNETTDDLMYAYTSEDGWKTTTVRSNGRTGLYTSLAINRSNNRPFIGFLDFDQQGMRIATLSGDDWTFQTVKNAGTTGLYNSMQFDSQGYPHIAYYDESTPGLRYARWDGSQWIYWILATGSGNGLYTSLALDSNDNPHIAFYNSATNDLRYIYWSGSAWSTIELVDDLGDVGKFADIAVDGNNTAHISYYDATYTRLKYAYRTSSGWVKLEVDNSGEVGAYSSIDLDSSFSPHIAYFVDTEDQLRYAYYDPIGRLWRYEVVDSYNSVGIWASMELDASNMAHISYYDFTDYNNDIGKPGLRYAKRNGPNSWSVTQVDGGIFAGLPLRAPETQSPDVAEAVDTVRPNGVGAYSSLALDSLGRPHISYYDADNTSLKYAYFNGAGWETRTVFNDGGISGWYTTIDVDGSNLPSIAFHHSSLRQLMYAHTAELDFQVYLPMSIR